MCIRQGVGQREVHLALGLIGRLAVHVGAIEARISGREARLFRQLWIMAAGIVGLTIALVKLIG